MTPQEMTAKEDARYAAMVGAERMSTIQYLQGLLTGRFGPVSKEGCDSAKRTLGAMGAYF